METGAIQSRWEHHTTQIIIYDNRRKASWKNFPSAAFTIKCAVVEPKE